LIRLGNLQQPAAHTVWRALEFPQRMRRQDLDKRAFEERLPERKARLREFAVLRPRHQRGHTASSSSRLLLDEDPVRAAGFDGVVGHQDELGPRIARRLNDSPGRSHPQVSDAHHRFADIRRLHPHLPDLPGQTGRSEPLAYGLWGLYRNPGAEGRAFPSHAGGRPAGSGGRAMVGPEDGHGPHRRPNVTNVATAGSRV
jgi:hypothetical protein